MLRQQTKHSKQEENYVVFTTDEVFVALRVKNKKNLESSQTTFSKRNKLIKDRSTTLSGNFFGIVTGFYFTKIVADFLRVLFGGMFYPFYKKTLS